MSFVSDTFKIAANTTFQLLAKAISVLSTVAATALITRRFGIDRFGAFFLMTGFATYFFLLLDFGLNTVAAREISRDRSLAKKIFANVAALRLCLSILLVVLLTLVLPLIPFRVSGFPYLRAGIAVGLLALISQALYNSGAVIFQSFLNYRGAVWASLVGNLTFLGLVFLIVFARGNVYQLVFANTFGTFLVSLTALLLVWRSLGGFRLSFEGEVWRSLLTRAAPLGATIFLTVIVAKADTFLLSVLDLTASGVASNAAALGHYGLAYKIFENVLVLPTYFVNALFPVMVDYHRQDGRKLVRTVKQALAAMLLVSLLVLLAGFFLAPLMIWVLAGPGYAAAVTALRILFLGLPFFFLSSVLMFYLITVGQENRLPGVYLFAAVFNVFLNYLFIPRYGFLAAAAITGLTEIVITVFLTMLVVKGRVTAHVEL